MIPTDPFITMTSKIDFIPTAQFGDQNVPVNATDWIIFKLKNSFLKLLFNFCFQFKTFHSLPSTVDPQSDANINRVNRLKNKKFNCRFYVTQRVKVFTVPHNKQKNFKLIDISNRSVPNPNSCENSVCTKKYEG